MATIRLFASVRAAAGTANDEVSARTVGEALEIASERYGPAFVELLGACRVWVNGEPAEAATPIGEIDEVAILPPVSGGV